MKSKMLLHIDVIISILIFFISFLFNSRLESQTSPNNNVESFEIKNKEFKSWSFPVSIYNNPKSKESNFSQVRNSEESIWNMTNSIYPKFRKFILACSQDEILRSSLTKKTLTRPNVLSFQNPFKNLVSTYIDSVQFDWVSYYGSGLIGGEDYGIAISTDYAGNMYVTGSSSGMPFGYDITTIKYNSYGQILWEARYGAENMEDDVPSDIKVDSAGNAYVIGSSPGSNGDLDYVTIKYNTEGVEQWVRQYNGSGNGEDQPMALALVGENKIYVTGFSQGMGTGNDILTIKYDSNGLEDWNRRYSGSGNGIDEAYDICYDPEGNIIVTGTSFENGTGYNYITVKYDSSGNEQWTAIYNDPTNGNDVATAIAIDPNGYIYVTGYGQYATYPYDYITVKYDFAGTFEWAVNYDGTSASTDVASDIVVNSEGFPYVTGWSRQTSTRMDMLTIRYDYNGNQVWAVPYNTMLGYYDDYAYSMTIDDQDNLFIAGQSCHFDPDFGYNYVTLKYDSYMNLHWVDHYDGPDELWNSASDIAVDRSGNVHVTGYCYDRVSDYDYANIKYTNSGTRSWVRQYESSIGSSYDQALKFLMDNNGNLYLTGQSRGEDKSWDYLTTKFNSNGQIEWACRYHGLSDYLDDYPQDMAVDQFGNVYVTGKSRNDSIDYDFVTVKYDANGNEQWKVRYNGPANYHDEPSGIVVDASGDVYVTGISCNSGSDYDFCTIKYNTSGVEQWVNYWDSGDDYSRLIAIDNSGDIIVTGLNSDEYDFVTIKYHPDGTLAWESRLTAGGAANDIVIDQDDNIFVTGRLYQNDNEGANYFTFKYDSNGNYKWLRQYNGEDSGTDEAKAIACDNEGNVYVTGLSDESGSDFTVTTIKYSTYGNVKWRRRFYEPNGMCFRNNIAVDQDGCAYLAVGDSKATESHFLIFKYDPEGEIQWMTNFHTPKDEVLDYPVGIAIDQKFNIYVGGSTYYPVSPGFWDLFTVVKYSQPYLGINDNKFAIPSEFWVAQNYPNPFNATTKFSYYLTKSCKVTLKVYNTLGQLVATLISREKNTGNHSLNWNAEGLPAGVYFYRFSAGEYSEIKKMILLK